MDDYELRVPADTPVTTFPRITLDRTKVYARLFDGSPVWNSRDWVNDIIEKGRQSIIAQGGDPATMTIEFDPDKPNVVRFSAQKDTAHG